MEPVVVIIIVLLSLMGGGAGTIAYRSKKKKERSLMRDAVQARLAVEGESFEISIFDVFWDLGVSDYALEIMGSQGYLLEDVQDLHLVHNHIAEDIATFGGYSAFVRENLETIQEFYREHRRAGNRRDVPALTSSTRKTLRLPAPDTDETNGEAKEDENLPVPHRGSHLPVVARDLEDRMSARRRNDPGLMPLQEGRGGFEVDVDEVTKLDPMRLVEAVFSGSLTDELTRWWEMRDLRTMRKDLDANLGRLFFHFQEEARRDPTIFDHLYDAAQRWDLEMRRIDNLLDERSWEGRPWELCADVLVRQARATARQLAWLAESNVDRTIERIRAYASSGDTAMAGYLIYLNHHAFFAGRDPSYGEHVRRIDNSTYRMQEEMRELLQRGVI